MSTNTSISLDDHFINFTREQVDSGRYQSVSEVIRAGLRLLEEREAEYSVLRKALAEGEASGVVENFDFEEFLSSLKSR
ncbi:type II toxin-antitoxin system ParD family antitoxin [Corynebacterium cystitidis]|uniref:type II toxin-antitoxin system ParD family antitoxin n=1 Tax=Corynebacterium cystitidis TaxID=35757 RepID=UPI00211DEC56|nr:type II toxin-antitoxin system ParD family antitoxin [Corynebacterium cystitidis]